MGDNSGSDAGNAIVEGERKQGGRRKTAWMAHVKATMRAHKGLKLKQVLKLAKKTYKKGMRGGFTSSGAGAASASPVGGQDGGRRRTRRSRRHH